MNFKDQINKQKLPKHVAIIMDGNGRWAKSKGKLRIFGHENGVKAVRETVEAAAEIGVDYLTLYAFSTENWNRPKTEVDALMKLLVKSLNKETSTLNKNNIRLQAIGNLDKLQNSTRVELEKAIESTKNNDRTILTLALSYSAREEITMMSKRIAEQVVSGELAIEDIDSKTIGDNLYTQGMPDPELLIRTSGEERISNFLLWQIAYTELYFTSKLWPDFRKEDFFEALLNFQNRERRFGKTSEQISK